MVVLQCTPTWAFGPTLPSLRELFALAGVSRVAVPGATLLVHFDVCPPTSLGFPSLVCPSPWASQDVAVDLLDVCPPTSLGFVASSCPSPWALSQAATAVADNLGSVEQGGIGALFIPLAVLAGVVATALLVALFVPLRTTLIRAFRRFVGIAALEAIIAKLQMALEECKRGLDVSQQELARYTGWLLDIGAASTQARERIADLTSQLSALTEAFGMTEVACTNTTFEGDVLRHNADNATCMHINRAYEREHELVLLQTSNQRLEDIVDALFSRVAWRNELVSREDEAYTERILELQENLADVEIKVVAIEERTAARVPQLLALQDKLSIARSSNALLAKDVDVLRQCREHLELQDQHIQATNGLELHNLQEDLNTHKTQLQEAKDRESAEQTRVDRLQEKLIDINSQAEKAQAAFSAQHAAAQEHICELTTALDARKATLDAAKDKNTALQSHRSAAIDRITAAKARIAAAALKKEQLLAERAIRRQQRHKEFDTLRQKNDGLRATQKASLADLDAQRKVLAEAQTYGAAGIATAEAARTEAKKVQDASLRTLEAKKRAQAKEVAHLTKRRDHYQTKVDQVGTDTAALEARFKEERPHWEEKHAERAALEQLRERKLAHFKKVFAEADAKRTIAEEKARDATAAAVAAEKQSQADKTQLKTAMQTFEQQLAAARGKKDTLEATVGTFYARRDGETQRQIELITQLNELPPSHAAQLQDLTDRLQRRSDEALVKRTTNPLATAAIRERESRYADICEAETQLEAIVEDLEGQLSDRHAELIREQRRRTEATNKRRAAERVVYTLRTVLATPLHDTPALEPSRRAERSPSLTPPPQTPDSEAGPSSWIRSVFRSKK